MQQDQVPALGRHSRQLKDLRKRVRRRRPGEVIADGLRLVSDLVRWGVPLDELYLAESVAEEHVNLQAAAAMVWTIPDEVLAGIAPTRHPQGVLAVLAEPQPAAWSPESGVSLWLDGLQEPGNVGAILRSAAALDAQAVLLSSGSADPYHPAAVRGSAGAVLRLPVHRDVGIEAAVDTIRAVGGQVWASGGGGVPVTGWRPHRPLLLLLGSEGRGLDEQVAAKADGRVTVPLGRNIESLNVAVATGILLQAFRSSMGG